jgi:hypothetical protein
MTTLAGEAHQAGWSEQDHLGHQVVCVTNSVLIRLDAQQVWVLGGSEDSPWETPPDCSVLLDASVRFGTTTTPRLEIKAFERERTAFRTLLPLLKHSHPGKFVAIHEGSVADSDTSREELVRRFFAHFGDVSVYIGYVGQPDMTYQVTPFLI